MKRPRPGPALVRLVEASALLRETALADVSRAARACAESRAQLSALAAPPVPPELPPAVAAEVTLRYQRWADQRRAALNLQLARQTAEWLEARRRAARVLGRDEALRRLRDMG
jgi:hypothetical protein